MAENSTPAETDAETEAGQRGALHVRDKVVDRIAAHAATTTSGVVPHSSGLNRVTGRDLPRVETTVAGAGLTVDAVDVAVTAVVHDTTSSSSSSTTRSVQ